MQSPVSSDVTIVNVHDASGGASRVSVFDRIWARAPGAGGIDVGTVVALAHSGNYAAVAYRDGDAVAGGLGFFGPPRSALLHSHIVGVLPGQTGSGLGRAIKLHQRAWCLERDVTTMSWTFDPLVARNAWFNLSRLGARVVSYVPDLYGTMDDALNLGHPSDRLVVHWDLRTALPTADGAPDAPAGRVRRVEVPPDIESMRSRDPDQALRWRSRVRDELRGLLDDGWLVVGFDRPGGYVLTRGEVR